MAPRVAPPLDALLADLSRRGVAVWVADGQVAVRPSDRLTPADRAMLRDHRAALVALLSCTSVPPWDLAGALHLMDAADAAVERSGVSGSHPEIQAAAARVSVAYAARDLAGVRAGCGAMTAVLLRFSAEIRPTAPGRSV